MKSSKLFGFLQRCAVNQRESESKLNFSVQCLEKKLDFMANPLIKLPFSSEGCMP